MPGTTPNDTMKDALDQAIIAINDLRTSVEDGSIAISESGGGNSTALTEITAKLEEIRTIYETEAIAGITAQNTNFDDLIAALSALVLTCTTNVSTTNVTQNITQGTGQGGPGIYPPLPPYEPGVSPVPPGSELAPNDPDRFCKVAYGLHDNVKKYAKTWDDHNIDTIATVGAGLALTAFIGLLAANIEALGAAIPFLEATSGRTIGFLVGQVTSFFTGGFDLGRISDILNNPDNEEDFICAAYYRPNESAHNNYLQVASDKGMTTGDLLLLRSIVNIDLFSYVYWAREQYIEDAIANFSSPFDCSTCEGGLVGPYSVVLGDETSEHPSNPVIGTFVYPGFGWNCGSTARVMVINFHSPVTITSIIPQADWVPCGGTGYGVVTYFSDEMGDNYDWEELIVSTNSPPQELEPISGVRSLYVTISHTDEFPTFEVEYTVE